MKTKEEYIDSLAAELKEWSAEIDSLNARAEQATDDLKIKYNAEVEVLRAKERAAHEKIAELKDASGDAWEALKGTADHVWQDLRTGLASVVSKFK
jgi:chromosome segregation ATPase